MTNVEILVGSITEQEVEAIVSSANTALVMGDEVAATILAEAGSDVEEEAVGHAPVAVGDVVVTGAGDLPMKHILHVAVVGDIPPDIYECTRNVIDKAVELGVSSIAMPALGSGSAGISVRESAEAMCTAIVDSLEDSAGLSEIRIVLWEDRHFETFERALRRARRARRDSQW